MGTSVYILSGNKPARFSKATIDENNRFWSVCEYLNGKFILGIQMGMITYDKELGTFHPFAGYNNFTELDHALVLDISPDRNQKLWICCNRGFYLLDTLAQYGTQSNIASKVNPAIIVTGKGSEMDNDKFLKCKGKKKIITQTLALNLITLAQEKEEFHKLKSLWNTYHCQNKLYVVDGKMHGRYCKNRFCTICSGNRKADIINRYLPVMKSWEKPYFLNLTVKACKAENLKVMLEWMMATFVKILQKYKKRNQRGSDLKIMGIKSLVCEFNPVTQTYNPHFHLIVASKEIAETIMKEWLSILQSRGKGFVVWKAQKSKPVFHLDCALIEIIKYGTKIFTPADVDSKSMNNKGGNIHVAAMANILEAMKGLRIFERFGFNLPKVSKEVTEARVTIDYSGWVYMRRFSDWVNTENELTLTGYIAPVQLVNLLKCKMDLQLE